MLCTSDELPLMVSTELEHTTAADSSVSACTVVSHSFRSVEPVHPAVHVLSSPEG